MKTFLDERFAPTTSRIGFLELPFEEALNGLREWNESLYTKVSVRRLDGQFSDVFASMEPLVWARRPKELLVAAGEWTAYFDNSALGSDPSSAIGALTRRLNCRGFAVGSWPPSARSMPDQRGRDGKVSLTIFGPLHTDWLNQVRALDASYRNGRVEFTMTGLEQWFEEPQAYASRRTKERFTSERLERYCVALGVNVFDPSFYGPQCAIVESNLVPRNPHAGPHARPGVRITVDEEVPWREATYDEIQYLLAIEPGAARAFEW